MEKNSKHTIIFITVFLLLGLLGSAQKNKPAKYFIVDLKKDTLFFNKLEIGLLGKIKGTTVDGKEKKYSPEEIRSCSAKEGLFDSRPLNHEKPTKRIRMMEVKKENGSYRYYEYEETTTTPGYNGIPMVSTHTYKQIYDGDAFIAELKRKNKKELLMKYFGVDE